MSGEADVYVTLHSWRVRGSIPGLPHGHWYTLSWKMTERQAREWAAAAGVEIEKVEGTAEVRRTIPGRPRPR